MKLKMSRTLKISVLLTVIFSLLPFAFVWLVHRHIPTFSDFFANVSPNYVIGALTAALEGVSLFFYDAFIVALLIVGAALLFDVTWKGKRIIKSRTPLHVYLGYFFTVLFLFSMFGAEVLYWYHERLWGTWNAPVLALTLVLVGFTILGARIMSKLPIKVEDTNLGSFIIVIYLSYVIFKVFSQGFDPIRLWVKIIRTELIPSYANALFFLSIPAIFAFVLMLLDMWVLRRLGDGRL